MKKETYEVKKLRSELKKNTEPFSLRYLQERNTALCQELQEAQRQIRRLLRWVRESFPQEREKMKGFGEESIKAMELQIKQIQEERKNDQERQVQQIQFLEAKVQDLEERLCEQEQGKEKYNNMLEKKQQQFLQYQNEIEKLRHIIHRQEDQILIHRSYLEEIKQK